MRVQRWIGRQFGNIRQCVGKPEGNQKDLTAFAFSDFLHTFRYLDMIDKVGGNHAKVQSNLPIVNR